MSTFEGIPVPVTWNDFRPCFNGWEVDENGEQYQGQPEHIIDASTGNKYWNESTGLVGFKCFLLTLGTLPVHLIAGVVNIGSRASLVLSLSHFWAAKEGEKSYSLKGRCKDLGKDLLNIACQPFTVVALELSAIYGILLPYNGRKLYATLERAQYGDFVLAPCFQPDPQGHLLSDYKKPGNI